ncbi:hypothetical protein JOQ06_030250 [Pogonophryne albipinna]|uniref:Uncharacterized protein n=1 Tax=Pogonophryne albipinna TaxID=1090488 RepID=A0AAD6FGY3_9TELE|nr:hypothetical protein JOQ06_030250 [Pogonophryne albipinna]
MREKEEKQRKGVERYSSPCPCKVLRAVEAAAKNVLHNAFYPKDPSFSLTLLHVLSAPLHGLANAFVFGLDSDWWSLLSPTGMQLALQSRLCDRTLIGEYHPGAVRYTQADLVDLSDDDDDNDTNVLFYSPDMTLKDRGP